MSKIQVSLTCGQWLDVVTVLARVPVQTNIPMEVFDDIRHQIREFMDSEDTRVSAVQYCVEHIEPQMNGELEFDLDAPVKEGADGSCYWVQCWHCVRAEDVE